MFSPRKLLRRLLYLALALFLAHLALAQLPRLGPVRNLLAARLTAAIGRPVEVGEFSLAFFPSPRLKASFVTIGEDPRFGREYFIRAESLSARFRWRSLLRCRFIVTALSFSRPSVNIVRSPDGHWNLESFLSTPASSPSTSSISPNPLSRIEVSDGRINFKRGPDKSPFALTDLRGSLDRDASAWRISLDARPVRAAVPTQEAGLLRLRANLAAPASPPWRATELRLIWQDASLADTLRLARGHDFGVRGRMALEATARRTPPSRVWSLSLIARLADVHRWDFPPRPSDPALLLAALATWDPAESRLEFASCTLDASRSRLELTGSISGPLLSDSLRAPARDADLRIVSSGIHFDDLLAWHRAFRPHVADALSLAGFARLDLSLRGWPPRPVTGTLTSDNVIARFAGPDAPAAAQTNIVPARIRLGPLRVNITPDALTLDPLLVRFLALPAASEFRASANFRFTQPRRFDLSVTGQTPRIESVFFAAASFGYPLYPDWLLAGGATIRLDGRFPFSSSSHASAAPRALTGNVEFRNATLSSSFLSAPVRLDSARLELTELYRRFHVTAVRAFGARWTGSLRSARFGEPWEFVLSADRLDSAQIARSVTSPAAAPGLLARVVPFIGARRGSTAESPLNSLHARGTLRVDQLVIAPLTLRGLRAEATLDGRTLHFPEAEAEFYGGAARGWFRAELTSEPVYRLQAQLANANLASLTATFPSLREQFTGAASGELTLSARGLTRAALLSSLEARGAAQFARPQTRLFDLAETLRAGRLRPGRTIFSAASASFTVSSADLTLDPLLLLSAAGPPWRATGSINFSGALNLRLTRPSAPSSPGLLLSGTLPTLVVSPLPAPAASPLPASPPAKSPPSTGSPSPAKSAPSKSPPSRP